MKPTLAQGRTPVPSIINALLSVSSSHYSWLTEIYGQTSASKTIWCSLNFTHIITNVRTVAMFVAVCLRRVFHPTSVVMLIVCLIRHFIRPSALIQSPQHALYHMTTDTLLGIQANLLWLYFWKTAR
jgi:hypothetical protein